jgi:hypothetical protein
MTALERIGAAQDLLAVVQKVSGERSRKTGKTGDRPWFPSLQDVVSKGDQTDKEIRATGRRRNVRRPLGTGQADGSITTIIPV